MSMHLLFITLQAFTIVILLVEFVFIFLNWTSKQESYLAMLCLASLINNVGYMMEICSNTTKDALFGTKICYIGKSYIPLVVLLFIIHFCEIPVKKWFITVSLLFQSFVVYCVLTCTENNLFYADILYTREGFFPHLVLKHGIVYYMFMGTTVLYFLYGCYCLAIKSTKVTRKSERQAIPYMYAMIATAAFGLILFMSGLTGGYDTTAVSYCAGAVFLLITILKFDLLKTVDLAKAYAAENLADGIVVVDENNDIIFINSVASSLLSTLPENTFMQLFVYAENKKEELTIGENIYKVSAKELYGRKSLLGTLYVLHEITLEYKYAEKLQEEVDSKTQDIEKMQHAIITSFANMVEAKDGITGAHIKHTSAYVEILVNAMKDNEHYCDLLDELSIKRIIQSAPLHDIGKIAIPDHILNKPGRFTDEEFEIMKTHAQKGAELLGQVIQEIGNNEYITIAKDMAMYHHEKWDGSGYPTGKKDLEIPMCARIMAVADVYDALRSSRSYKKAFTKEKAIEILIEGRGTHFDPVMVDLFLEHIDEVEAIACKS